MFDTQPESGAGSWATGPGTGAGPKTPDSSPNGETEQDSAGTGGDGNPSPEAAASVLAHWSESGDSPAAAPGEAGNADDPQRHAAADKGLSGSGGALPHLSAIQRSFGDGHDLSAVRAHVGGQAAQASAQLRAHGFARGEQIGFGANPSLHLAAHEAAHVVQQRAGVHLYGGGGADDSHERHADQVADRVVAGKSAADLLPHKGNQAPSGGPVQLKPKKKAAAPKVDPAQAQKEAQAQADADALGAAIGLGSGEVNVGEVVRVLSLPTAQLRLVRAAYEKKPPAGSAGLGKDVLDHIPKENRAFAIKALSRVGAAPLKDLSPEDRQAAALHDGDENTALGEGDQVLDDKNRVIPTFPATAEGVVQAAFYELHRGDKRPLAEIMADKTGAKTDRGAHAAIEGGKNVDKKETPKIGTITKNVKKKGETTQVTSALGPVEIYQKVGGAGAGDPWCGCFATFVYARAGITVPTLAWSINVPNVLSGMGDKDNPGAYYQVGSTPNPKHKKDELANDVNLRTGQQSKAGSDGVGKQSYKDSKVASLAQLDVRPGDVFWQEHSATKGHVGMIVGVHRTPNAITMVTIEGNVSDQVKSSVRTITRAKDGKVTSGVKGWGRPPQLNSGAPPQSAPEGDGEMPEWIDAANKKPKTNDSTR